MDNYSRLLRLLILALVGLGVGCGPAPAGDGAQNPQPTPGEERTYRYSQLLGRDSIRPVYDPEFVPADEAPLDDRALVLGVAIDGQAKAYPITVLNFREMVNDTLADVPILATW